MTTTGDAAAGGTRQNEMISIGGANYIKVHDKWTVSPMTPKMMAEQEKENIRDAKVYRCQYERDENVNGEAAAVYKAHSRKRKWHVGRRDLDFEEPWPPAAREDRLEWHKSCDGALRLRQRPGSGM